MQVASRQLYASIWGSEAGLGVVSTVWGHVYTVDGTLDVGEMS